MVFANFVGNRSKEMKKVEKLYKPKEIAAWFIPNTDYEAGSAMTHLKLPKLLFYAQAFSLAINDRPLFEEDFQAWKHGTVLPSIWKYFKNHGYNLIDPIEMAKEFKMPKLEPEDKLLLEEVWKAYARYDAKYLELLTHSEDPWIIARDGLDINLACKNVISKKSMQEYYKTQVA